MFERCELLVRIRDKLNPDCPYKCASLHKAGDVIVMMPAGHEWSAAEQSNPDWLILLVSGEDAVEQCSSLLTPELGSDPSNPSRMLQRRGFRIDLSQLPACTDNFTHVPIGLLMSWKIKVEPLNDPNVAS